MRLVKIFLLLLLLGNFVFKAELAATDIPEMGTLPGDRIIQTPEGIYFDRDLGFFFDFMNETHDHVHESHADHEHLWADYFSRTHPSFATVLSYIDDASAEFGVPSEILTAIAYVENNFTQVGPSIDMGWGIMHLVSNDYARTLDEAAILLNLPQQTIKDDPRQNIRAAAALLSHYYSSSASTGNNLEDWRPAVERFSALISSDLREMQAKTYYEVIQNGVKGVNLWGESILLAPHNINVETIFPSTGIPIGQSGVRSADYSPASSQFTSCNYSARSGSIDTWVNHYIAVGTYAGAISWFQNCNADASAHFIIRAYDGQIAQLVGVNNSAWHAGSSSYPMNNHRSIGVEHEVTTTNPQNWNSAPMLQASVNMACYFAQQYNIPPTRSLPGIRGHQEMPGAATLCPGNMPWDDWMNDFTNCMNGGTLCQDDNEPINENLSTAPVVSVLNLSAANETVTSVLSNSNDEDWYAIDLLSPGTVNLTLSNLPGDYELELYNAGYLDGSYNPSNMAEDISFFYGSITDTTIYVRVYGYNGAYSPCNGYDLQLNWVPDNDHCPVGATCMDGTAFSGCGGLFMDPGGLGNYPIDQEFVQTFYPGSSTEAVSLYFWSFGTESCCDYMRLYDGPDTNATLIGQYQGTNSPGIVHSTHLSGALTAHWYSNEQGYSWGWQADIGCVSRCSAPQIDSILTGPDRACYGEELSLQISPVPGATNYSWNMPSTWLQEDSSNQITILGGTGTGEVCVTAENQCGLSSQTCKTVTFEPQLQIATTHSPPTTAGANDGHILLNAFGGTGAYTYMWSTGETTPNLSDLYAGLYSVTVNDQAGCSFVHEVLIEDGPEICAGIQVHYTNQIQSRSAKLNWDVITGVESYEIQGGIAGRGVAANFMISDPNTGSFVVNGLTASTNYFWQVRAVCDANAALYSEWSALDVFTTLCRKPDQIYTSAITSNSATLNWNTISAGQGYEIQGRIRDGNWISISINNRTVGHKDVRGLAPDQIYDWRIRSKCNSNGDYSEWSQIVSFYTPIPATKSTQESNNVAYSEIELFPLPNNGNFTILLPANSPEPLDLQISDIQGKSIPFKYERDASSLEIQVINPQPGILIMSIVLPDKIISRSVTVY